jgi:tetratricopeptide (TPR) repeat protein
MATYLGNPALSSAVKERVSTTFQQAVALYKQGRTDEVLAGCDLILKMDPQFQPARKLQEKTRNPMAPIDVDSLVPSSDADNALALARKAMAVRDFQQVVNITTEILTNDLLNDDARVLGDEAREKIEAGPFVDQFFRKCEQHVSAANIPLAKQDLEKARALDSDHPSIARMEAMIAGATLGPSAAAPQPAAPQPFSFGAPTPPASFDFGAPPSPSFVVDNAGGSASGRGTADAAEFGFMFEEEKPSQPAMPSGGFSFDSVSAAPPPAPPRPTPPPAAPPAPPAAFGFGAPEPEAPSFGNFSFETPAAAPPTHGAGSSFNPTGGGGAPAGGFSFGNPEPAAGGFSFDAPAPSSPTAGASAFGAPGSEPADFNFGAPSAPSGGGFSFGAPAPEASGFSFDAPAAPADAFDFTSGEVSPDDKRKIDQYLADGDRAFSSGDYQSAIDLWSRIFLIDVTNEQASDRIEKAKLKRRETEQRVEGMLGPAIAAYDKGDTEGATRQFNEILRLDPANDTAVDYIERLSRGSAGAAGRVEANAAPFLNPSNDSSEGVYDGTYDDGLGETNSDYGTTLTPPDPGGIAAPSAAKTKADAKSARKSASPSKPKPLVMVGAIIGVLAVLGGGYFAWMKLAAKPPAPAVSGAAIIEQAKGRIGAGEYDRAIAMLQEVPPADPMHDRALEMIADLQHKKVQASEMINGKPAMVVYQENLTNAKTAFDAHDYMTAKNLLDDAAKIRPLPPEMKQMYDASAQQMSKLESSLAFFKEGKYQDAVANLEPLLAEDPLNKSVKQLLGNAHFNLGAIALQGERVDEAVKQFDIVLQSDPADEAAKRSKELALKYQGQPKDLLYKIYVKYLPLR